MATTTIAYILSALSTALVSVLAARAQALPGRPLSDLRFEGRARTNPAAVASDGRDFLVLSSMAHSHIDGGAVFTQKVVNGKPAGPHHQIGRGEATGLWWTGSEYLAVWNDGEYWIARLSRDGSLLAAPSRLPGNKLAVGRASALLVVDSWSHFDARPLDLSGTPSGGVITHDHPSAAAAAAVVPTADGFAVIGFNSFDLDRFWTIRLRPDGSAIAPAMRVDVTRPEPRHRLWDIAAASDGTDTLVVYTSGAENEVVELRTVIIGPDGKVKSQHLLHSIAGGRYRALVPASVVWDGAQYVAAITMNARGPDVSSTVLRIDRDGRRSGQLVPVTPERGWWEAIDLGWNGREFLVTGSDAGNVATGTFAVRIDGATLTAAPPLRLGRTLSSQAHLTLAPGRSDYLAAWFEEDSDRRINVRASRIDRSGNYLDGEGVVLGEAPHRGYALERPISIDGAGPDWLVVWSDGVEIRARRVSRNLVPIGAQAVTLGRGHSADILWDDGAYLLLRATEGSIYQEVVRMDGTVGGTRLLASYEDLRHVDPGLYVNEIVNVAPRLLRLGGRVIATFVKTRRFCIAGSGMPNCGDGGEVIGLALDGGPATPFVIGGQADSGTSIRLASDSTGTLLVWSGHYFGIAGAFLPAGAPEQARPFYLRGVGSIGGADVAFDGRTFVTSWYRRSYPDYRRFSLVVSRITSTGTIASTAEIPLDSEVFAVHTAIAASATLPALIGFLDRRADYDNVRRGELLFASEIDRPPSALAAPENLCATEEPDGTVSVEWRPVREASGVLFELELPDRSFRTIGVAPAGGVRARISRAGLEGSAIRARAWNRNEWSRAALPSAISSAPEVFVPSSLNACASEPATIGMRLSGLAPFTVRWSDGVVQSNLTRSATRVVTVPRDTTLTIVSVSDAGCGIDETPHQIRIAVTPRVEIMDQPHELRVARGQTAALTVQATAGSSFEWFEGALGDTSRSVGTNDRSYTTPPLFQTSRYWVRVSNRCGTVASAPIVVAVSGKTRAVRR